MFRNYSRRPNVLKSSYYANEIASLYNFPPADGAGQTVGIIELGGGYSLRDLDIYGNKLGLPPINITAVSVDGASNDPADTSGANDEVMLDIEIIYAIVPKAHIRVYFAPNTDQGFVDAIKKAISDRVNVISISWGASEKEWSTTTINSMEAVFKQAANAGITVLASAGDSGADDDSGDSFNDLDVDYPGSSSLVVSCGGTQLTSTGEIVWNNLDVEEGATGAGMSSLFTRPVWQTKDGIDKPNRCLPDITGNASPLTGYSIIVGGQWEVLGGTSCCSPLYAGLIARINQILDKNIGYANPILYALNNRSYLDIVNGSNSYWVAGPKYDLASGLGRLVGINLIDDIKWALNNASNNI